MIQGGATVFSATFGCGRKLFSKSLYLAKLPLLWFFGQRAGFCWELFLSVSICGSRLLALSALCLGYMRQKREHILQVLSSLATLPLSFHLPEFSYICFVHNMQVFQFCLLWKNRKSTATPSSQIYFHIINKQY